MGHVVIFWLHIDVRILGSMWVVGNSAILEGNFVLLCIEVFAFVIVSPVDFLGKIYWEVLFAQGGDIFTAMQAFTVLGVGMFRQQRWRSGMFHSDYGRGHECRVSSCCF